MKKFFKFGAKGPVSFSLFVTTFSFFVFIFSCAAAGFFTRENLSGFVMMGAKIHLLLLIVLAVTFRVVAQNSKPKKQKTRDKEQGMQK